MDISLPLCYYGPDVLGSREQREFRKSPGMNTYEKCARNFPEMNTSKIMALKLVQNEHFWEEGWGYPE